MKTKEKFQVKPGSYLLESYANHKFKTEVSLTNMTSLNFSRYSLFL